MKFVTDSPIPQVAGMKVERALIEHVLFHADNKNTVVSIKNLDIKALFYGKGTHFEELPELQEGDIVYTGSIRPGSTIITWFKTTYEAPQ